MESYDTIIDMENLHSLGGQFVIVVLALCLLVLGLITILLVASDLAGPGLGNIKRGSTGLLGASTGLLQEGFNISYLYKIRDLTRYYGIFTQ